jgi:hypothetical protein
MTDIFSAISPDVRHNQVGLMIRPSLDWVEVDGIIDKASLPAEYAELLADPCVIVTQGVVEVER